ncbi:MAG: HEPN domain-containing protein [Deltaproteobacteria bacterium]|nr:HEPN domain-containing protein [Deltaproteobacteria bacterium]
MEPFLKEAEKWLRQAEYDLKAAEWTQQGGFHAQATFLAQQSAAKSLRAFLFLSKEDARETRSVVELIDRAIVHWAFRSYIPLRAVRTAQRAYPFT